VCSRIRYISSQIKNVRIVALSSSVTNAKVGGENVVVHIFYNFILKQKSTLKAACLSPPLHPPSSSFLPSSFLPSSFLPPPPFPLSSQDLGQWLSVSTHDLFNLTTSILMSDLFRWNCTSRLVSVSFSDLNHQPHDEGSGDNRTFRLVL